VALFFARAFYAWTCLTIGDFYKKRYGKGVEVLTSIAVHAVLPGLDLGAAHGARHRLQLALAGAISLDAGILIGAVVVLIYTTYGGMWSVALTDLFQSVVIVVGLIYVAVLPRRHGGRRRAPWCSTRLDCGQVPVLAHRRQQGVVGLRGAPGQRSHRLDPAAGRVPARDQRQGRGHRDQGSLLGAAPISASPSCRCSSPTRR
jgi:Na+(H+)/acetate symporter ActP